MFRKFSTLNITDSNGIQIGSSNKCILSTSVITANRTITIPDVSDTLVCKNTTDILTNKVLNGTTNDIEANKIGQSSNAVTVSGTASSGMVLQATSANTASWQTIVASYANLDSTDYIDMYSTSTSTYSSIALSIPFSVERNVGSNYTHNTNSSDITINSSGTYLVFSNVTALLGGNSTSQVALIINGIMTTDYNYYMYCQNSYYTSGSSSWICVFNAYDVIKLQIKRVNGSGTNSLISGGCKISLIKLF